MRLTIFVLAFFVTTVSAHHSTVGIFDTERIIEIEGIVTATRWRNPHAAYTVAVSDEQGSTVEWAVETGSISTLRLRGVDPDVIQAGDRVRFAGEASRRNLPEMFALNLLVESGQEVLLTARSAPRWPEGLRGDIYQVGVDETAANEARGTAEGIFRVWSTVFNDRDSFPLYGEGVGSLTESAQALKAQFDPTTSPYLGCDPRGVPYLMTNPYPFEFARREDNILLLTEIYDAERIIHMDGEVTPMAEYSPLGYSVGHWEDNTLVVATDRIDAPYFYGDGTPQSRAIQLAERFTLNEAEDRLDYSLTVTDPETFTQPMHFTRYWAWQPHIRREPYNCVE